MAGIRTFLDSCSLINAFRGSEANAIRLIELLEDPKREFISTSLVKLEVLPKPTANKKKPEVEFYSSFFDRVDHWIPVDETLVAKAFDHGCRYSLGPLDSMHVGAALEGAVEEFITDERASKPFFSVIGLHARHLSDP